MTSRSLSTFLTLGAAATLLLGTAGCARRAAEAPPTPAPAPVVAAPDERPVPPPTASPSADEGPGEFPAVFFDFDSHALSEAARTTLDQSARLLRERPDTRVTIEGHCDERGTVEYNLALGERRARAVREFLLAAGVAAGNIQIVSFGKEKPFDEGRNEVAWANNRRAQFVLR